MAFGQLVKTGIRKTAGGNKRFIGNAFLGALNKVKEHAGRAVAAVKTSVGEAANTAKVAAVKKIESIPWAADTAWKITGAGDVLKIKNSIKSVDPKGVLKNVANAASGVAGAKTFNRGEAYGKGMQFGIKHGDNILRAADAAKITALAGGGALYAKAVMDERKSILQEKILREKDPRVKSALRKELYGILGEKEKGGR